MQPTVADGVPVRWLDPAAPWAAAIGARPDATTYEAAVVATVELRFDEAEIDLVHTERLECVLFPLGEPSDVSTMVAVDHDVRDLRSEPPAPAAYRVPDAPVHQRSYFSALQKSLVEHLLASRTTSVLVNRELDLASRPGEDEAAFRARCDEVGDDRADAAVAKVARGHEARIRRARDAIATAQDRVDQAEVAMSSRRNDELVSGAGDLLGSLFGRRSARTIASKVGTATRRRGRAKEAAERVEAARARVDDKAQALADLEADLAEELATIADEWDERVAAVEALEVPLERSDVRLVELALVWVPVA